MERDLAKAEAQVEKWAKAKESSAVLKPAPRVASTGKAAKTAKSSTKAAKKPKAERDDLQVLSGVGPALEKKLNKAGVRSYADLVALDKDALEGVADKVGFSVQKMRSGKWIPTARREHKAKYGSKL